MMAEVQERLNPLLKGPAREAADEAACRLDGMFRDLFNREDRMDLIVTIIRAATSSMLGVPADRPDDMADRARNCTYGNPDCPKCNPGEARKAHGE